MDSGTPEPTHRLCPTVINDDRIVLMGLLTEVDGKLRRTLGAELEEACGLPLVWFEVLIRTVRSEEGRLTMSEVAAQTVHTSGGTTRLIDRIEEAGYVRRASCPSDRRTTYVEVTPAGEAKLEEATEIQLGHLETHLTSKLTDAERKILLQALTKLNGGQATCTG